MHFIQNNRFIDKANPNKNKAQDNLAHAMQINSILVLETLMYFSLICLNLFLFCFIVVGTFKMRSTFWTHFQVYNILLTYIQCIAELKNLFISLHRNFMPID